ncbi:hypothetical protein ACLOJK_023339 [Asimina triloba]
MQSAEHFECGRVPRLGKPVSDYRLKYIRLDQVEGMKCAVDWWKWGESNALECLEFLYFRYLPSLEKVFDGGVPTGCRELRRITIQSCPKLKCIFSSDLFRLLHQLEYLYVSECEEIEEIVERGQLADSTLQQLLSLNLSRLPKLTAICSQYLLLTSVKRVEIVDCPELKTLLVLCSGIQEINGKIAGSREWWEGIVWEDEHSKEKIVVSLQKWRSRMRKLSVPEAAEEEAVSEPEAAEEEAVSDL